MPFTYLVPDMDQTMSIDVYETKLENELQSAKNDRKEAQTDKDATDEDRRELEAQLLKLSIELDEYREVLDGPTIDIGYIPEGKNTELSNKHTAALKGKSSFEEIEFEELDKLTDILRETVTWGVRGHTFPDVEFKTVKGTYQGKEYDLVAPETVAFYERNNWLNMLRARISVYNALGDTKKKQSGSGSGIDLPISTVICAEQNQNLGS